MPGSSGWDAIRVIDGLSRSVPVCLRCDQQGRYMGRNNRMGLGPRIAAPHTTDRRRPWRVLGHLQVHSVFEGTIHLHADQL